MSGEGEKDRENEMNKFLKTDRRQLKMLRRKKSVRKRVERGGVKLKG